MARYISLFRSADQGIRNIKDTPSSGGPVAFFMKPFDDEKFIAAVRDALNQSLSRK